MKSKVVRPSRLGVTIVTIKRRVGFPLPPILQISCYTCTERSISIWFYDAAEELGIVAYELGIEKISRRAIGHFVAEKRKLSGDNSQITREFTGRLAPCRSATTALRTEIQRIRAC